MFNNAFPIHPRNPPNLRKITTPNSQTTTTTRKWATFTYGGREMTFITNLFKKTDLKIALRSNNTIQGLLVHNKQITDKTDKYRQCTNWPTRTATRHMWDKLAEIFWRDLTNTKPHSRQMATLQTLQNTSSKTHSFGPIHNTMQVLQHHSKGAHPNAIKRYIYAEFTKNNHLNDEHTISPNKTFEAMLNLTSHKPPRTFKAVTPKTHHPETCSFYHLLININ